MNNLYELDQSQIDKFYDDGFLLLDYTIDLSLIDQALQDMQSLHKTKPKKDSYQHGERVQDAWKYSQAVHALATEKNVLRALDKLYGRKALPFQTLNFPIGTQQKLHSDTVHFNSMPSGFMAGAWIALEDVDMENGALIYYPGSHKLKEYNMQDLGYEAGRKHYPDYENFMENWAKTSGNEPYYGVMKKGQVLLWHANLLHGGSKHIDKKRTRHSQVTHYFFEGCKYYTPMSSTPDKIHWRNPTWIPREPESLAARFKRFVFSHQ